MMRNVSFRGKFVGLMLFIVAIAPACNKNSPNSIDYQTATVTYVLANASNATLFKQLVSQAGLDSTLAGTGPFTVFVPTDDVMSHSGYSLSGIAGMPADSAKSLVLYHIIAGTALLSDNLTNRSEWKLITADGDSVFVSSDSNTVHLSGVPVGIVDLPAANGVLHSIGSVLTPPRQTLAQAIAADTALSFMQSALQHATNAPDSLSTRLSGAGVYTVFAPDNDAFRALGYQHATDLASANGDSLRHLLLAHFIPQRLMSYDISDQSRFKNANDSTVLFSITGLTTTLRLQSSDSLSAATVVSQDARAVNGVLFKVAAVLK